MKFVRSYKYLINPTKSQMTKLKKTLEVCRFFYNKMLELKIETYKESGVSLSAFDLDKRIKDWVIQHSELISIHSQLFQNVNDRISKAYNNFFSRVKRGEKPGFPRFRSFDRYDSFTFPQSGFKVINNNFIQISKIGKVKINMHRKLEGQVKRLTIKREGLKWFAVFSVEKEVEVKPREIRNVVGLDLGVKNFLVLSNGEVVDNPKFLNNSLTKLKKAQSKYSIKKTAKTKDALVRLHIKVRDQRKDFLHKLSRELVNKYDQIFIENLDIQGMLKNNWTVLHRNILDSGWNNFSQMLQYKAAYAGVLVEKVDPRNTSKRCSACGELVPKTLATRVHNCQYCGLVLDRDLNAAINIKRVGLDSLEPRALRSPGIHTGE